MVIHDGSVAVTEWLGRLRCASSEILYYPLGKVFGWGWPPYGVQPESSVSPPVESGYCRSCCLVFVEDQRYPCVDCY